MGTALQVHVDGALPKRGVGDDDDGGGVATARRLSAPPQLHDDLDVGGREDAETSVQRFAVVPFGVDAFQQRNAISGGEAQIAVFGGLVVEEGDGVRGFGVEGRSRSLRHQLDVAVQQFGIFVADVFLGVAIRRLVVLPPVEFRASRLRGLDGYGARQATPDHLDVADREAAGETRAMREAARKSVGVRRRQEVDEVVELQIQLVGYLGRRSRGHSTDDDVDVAGDRRVFVVGVDWARRGFQPIDVGNAKQTHDAERRATLPPGVVDLGPAGDKFTW